MTYLTVILQVSWWKDPITVATVVVAIFTVVSVVVSAFMWSATREQARISREIFEAAHRPYVGVESVEGMIYQGRHGRTMQIALTVRNSGSVPARNIAVTWHVAVGNQEAPREPQADQPIVLIPHQTSLLHTTHTLSDDVYTAMDAGSLVNIIASIKYKGITEKQYSHCQHAIYGDTGFAMTEADFS